MSEYFANNSECHDLLPCTLRSHRVGRLGRCPTGPPVGGVTSTSTPSLWPCAVLWPCTFCSDRNVRISANIYTWFHIRAPLGTCSITGNGSMLYLSVNFHFEQVVICHRFGTEHDAVVKLLRRVVSLSCSAIVTDGDHRTTTTMKNGHHFISLILFTITLTIASKTYLSMVRH